MQITALPEGILGDPDALELALADDCIITSAEIGNLSVGTTASASGSVNLYGFAMDTPYLQTEGKVLAIGADNALEWVDNSTGGGISSIVEGNNIAITTTDPANPIVAVVNNPTFDSLEVTNSVVAGDTEVDSLTINGYAIENPAAGSFNQVLTLTHPTITAAA